MEIALSTVGRGSGQKHAAVEELLTRYGERIGHFARFRIENFATEERFLAAVERLGGRGANPQGGNSRRGTAEKQKSRNPAVGRANLLLTMLDRRGKSLSTEQFAEWLRRERDAGARQLAFAIGPANGWSDAARDRAGMLLSLGPMTLPHELAAVVLAEQIYRAFTIIENHPYHLGHK